jgi:hypothetical protein
MLGTSFGLAHCHRCSYRHTESVSAFAYLSISAILPRTSLSALTSRLCSSTMKLDYVERESRG